MIFHSLILTLHRVAYFMNYDLPFSLMFILIIGKTAFIK